VSDNIGGSFGMGFVIRGVFETAFPKSRIIAKPVHFGKKSVKVLHPCHRYGLRILNA
jgi:hypothetical protein